MLLLSLNVQIQYLGMCLQHYLHAKFLVFQIRLHWTVCRTDMMLREGVHSHLRKRRSVSIKVCASVAPLMGGFTGAKVSAVTKLITFFWLLLTLYSCGNVIVLVTVHFINNWFMMILVAVYVYLKINAMKSLWL